MESKKQIYSDTILNIMEGNNAEYQVGNISDDVILIENLEITSPPKANFPAIEFISEAQFSNKIEFRACSFLIPIAFNKSKFLTNISFTDCTFERYISFDECEFHESFSFERCQFIESLSFYYFKCNEFYIDDCVFLQSLSISNGALIQPDNRNIKWRGREIKNIRANAISISENDLSFLFLSFHYIDILGIESGTYKNQLLIKKSNRNDIFDNILNGENLNELKINITAENDLGKVLIFNSIINVLKLTGDFHKGNLIFEDLTINIMNITDFSNFSTLKFLNIRPSFLINSKVEIKNSYLGKAQFYDVKFNSYGKVLVDKSHLTEIQCTYVSWPIKIYTADNEPEHLKENYRQLKLAMKKQEDNIHALLFEKEEMNAYLNMLKKTNGKWSERFILWTNKYSNDFGINWLLPIAYMILTNILFFILIGLVVDSPNQPFNCYINLWAKGLFLFNPTHTTKNISESLDTNNLALIFDFLSRITTGYFIFQTIRAFRKYSK